MPRRQYGKGSSTTINPASRSAPLRGVSSCHCQTQLSFNCRAASPVHSLTGPILLCRCSARACTQSGITTAASSTWACLDEGSPPRPCVEVRLRIYTRLHSHASGRRSGDQFCVYVADRLVLPTLSQEDISAIGSGRHQMDAFVRRYIHENLCFRFVMLPDGAAAYNVEAAIKNGDWEPRRSRRSGFDAVRAGIAKRRI
jgi:hypothetical protein